MVFVGSISAFTFREINKYCEARGLGYDDKKNDHSILSDISLLSLNIRVAFVMSYKNKTSITAISSNSINGKTKYANYM